MNPAKKGYVSPETVKHGSANLVQGSCRLYYTTLYYSSLYLSALYYTYYY